MEELNLKDFIGLFWKKKLQIILIVLIFAVIGTVYTMGFVTPLYNSSTTLVLASKEDKSNTIASSSSSLSESGITTSDITINSKLVSTYSELVKSKKILRTVISNLKIKIDEEQLRKRITVSSVKNTELIEIMVSNEDPVIAAKVANEIAEVFINEVKEIYNLNNIHIVDKAETSVHPDNINHIKDVVIFSFVGLAIAIGYVLLANVLDTTVNSVEDLEKILGLPVLASIPMCDLEGKNLKGGKRKR